MTTSHTRLQKITGYI